MDSSSKSNNENKNNEVNSKSIFISFSNEKRSNHKKNIDTRRNENNQKSERKTVQVGKSKLIGEVMKSNELRSSFDQLPKVSLTSQPNEKVCFIYK